MSSIKLICWMIPFLIILNVFSQVENNVIDYIGWELEIYHHKIVDELIHHEKTDALIQSAKFDFNYTGNGGASPRIDQTNLDFFSNYYARDIVTILETPEFKSAIRDQNVFNQLFPSESASSGEREVFTAEELKYIRENFLQKEETRSRIITDTDNYIPDNIKSLMENISPEETQQILQGADNFVPNESGLLLPGQPTVQSNSFNFQLPPGRDLNLNQPNQEQLLNDPKNNPLFDERYSQLNASQIQESEFKNRIYNKMRKNFPLLSNQYKRRIMRFRHLSSELKSEFLRRQSILPVLKDELMEEGLRLKFDGSTFELYFNDSKIGLEDLEFVPKNLAEFKRIVNKVGRLSSRVQKTMESSGGELASQMAGPHIHLTFSEEVPEEELEALMHQLKLDIAHDIYDEYERKGIPEKDRKVFKISYSSDIKTKLSHIRKVNKGVGAARHYEIRELTKPYDNQIEYIQSYFNPDGSINKVKYNELVARNVQRTNNVANFMDRLNILRTYSNTPFIRSKPTSQINQMALSTLQSLEASEDMSPTNKLFYLNYIISIHPESINDQSLIDQLKSTNKQILSQIDFNDFNNPNLGRNIDTIENILKALSKYKKKLGFVSIKDVRKVYFYYLQNYLERISFISADKRLARYLTLLNHDFEQSDEFKNQFVELLSSTEQKLQDFLKSLDQEELIPLGINSNDLKGILDNYEEYRLKVPEKAREIVDKIILNEALVTSTTNDDADDIYKLALKKIKKNTGRVNQRENLILKLSEPGGEAYRKANNSKAANESLVNALLKYHDDKAITRLMVRSLIKMSQFDARVEFRDFLEDNDQIFKEKINMSTEQFTNMIYKDYFKFKLNEIGDNLAYEPNRGEIMNLLNEMTLANTRVSNPHNTIVNDFLNYCCGGKYSNLMPLIEKYPTLGNNVIEFSLRNGKPNQKLKFAREYVKYFDLDHAIFKTPSEYLHAFLISKEEFDTKRYLNPDHPRYVSFTRKTSSISVREVRNMFHKDGASKIKVLRKIKQAKDRLESLRMNRNALKAQFKVDLKKATSNEEKIRIMNKFVNDLEAQGYRIFAYIDTLFQLAKNGTSNPINQEILKIIEKNLVKIKDHKKKYSFFITTLGSSREGSSGTLFNFPEYSFLNKGIEDIFFNQQDIEFHLATLDRLYAQNLDDSNDYVDKLVTKVNNSFKDILISGDHEKIKRTIAFLNKLRNFGKNELAFQFSRNISQMYQQLNQNQRANLFKSFEFLSTNEPKYFEHLTYFLTHDLSQYVYVKKGAQFATDVLENKDNRNLILNENALKVIRSEMFLDVNMILYLIKNNKFDKNKQKATNLMLDLLLTHKRTILSSSSVVGFLEIEPDYLINHFKQIEELCPYLNNCSQFLTLNLEQLKELITSNPEHLRLREAKEFLESAILKQRLLNCSGLLESNR